MDYDENYDGDDNGDQAGDHGRDHGEYETVVQELRALRELEGLKRFLQVENLKLKNQIDTCAGELEGIAISMSAVEMTVDSYDTEIKKCEKDEEKLKETKEVLMRDISELHTKIKAAKEDDASCSRLIDALRDDLSDVEAKKEVSIKRLMDIREGIQTINREKKLKMPRLRVYDSVLKQLHTAFRESENRMEVSLMLKQKVNT